MRPYQRLLTYCALLLAVVSASASDLVRGEEPAARVLFDFEQAGLGTSWMAAGPMRVGRQPLPERPEGKGELPAGQAVEIATEGKAIFASAARTRAARLADNAQPGVLGVPFGGRSPGSP